MKIQNFEINFEKITLIKHFKLKWGQQNVFIAPLQNR